jgi:hypothetical protein
MLHSQDHREIWAHGKPDHIRYEKYLFLGVRKMEIDRIGTRTFRNGKVFLRYKPV